MFPHVPHFPEMLDSHLAPLEFDVLWFIAPVKESDSYRVAMQRTYGDHRLQVTIRRCLQRSYG